MSKYVATGEIYKDKSPIVDIRQDELIDMYSRAANKIFEADQQIIQGQPEG